MENNQKICWMSASDLALSIRKKKISPVEAVSAVLERIEAVNNNINAYVTVCDELAIAAARNVEKALMSGEEIGVLCGVPIGIKDTTFTKGIRTTAGSKLMENFVPDIDDVIVERLKKAGAIVIGKTNVPEFAFKAVTDNLIFGHTRNPWNLARTAGGSSGGSAAAVAAGLGAITTGSDAGGSIRIPASCCGVFGMKPQYGRVPNYPLFHLWESMLHKGPITRTVKDAALMLDVMAGRHFGDRHSIPSPQKMFVNSLHGGVKGLKIGWSPDLGYATVSNHVLTICEYAVKKFAEMGANVDEVALDFSGVKSQYQKIFLSQYRARLSLFGTLNELSIKMDPQVIARVKLVENLTATEYLKVTFSVQELAANIESFFKTYDLLLTPTQGITAWPLGIGECGAYPEEIEGKPVELDDWLLTYAFNLTGHPAASIPAGWTEEGLPVGLQIIGGRDDEATIFRAAAAFEKANPWADRKPVI